MLDNKLNQYETSRNFTKFMSPPDYTETERNKGQKIMHSRTISGKSEQLAIVQQNLLEFNAVPQPIEAQ